MIKHGPCNRMWKDLLNGVHQPDDIYMIALYGPDAELGPETTAYTKEGEVSGPGYVAGGRTLKGRKVVCGDDFACLDFADPAWPEVSITAAGALIYNKSKGGASMAVLGFGGPMTAQNGPFRIQFPTPGPEGLLPIALADDEGEEE